MAKYIAFKRRSGNRIMRARYAAIAYAEQRVAADKRCNFQLCFDHAMKTDDILLEQAALDYSELETFTRPYNRPVSGQAEVIEL